MKRDELTISVASTLGGRWLAQVRDEFGLSFPHARSREEAVAWGVGDGAQGIRRRGRRQGRVKPLLATYTLRVTCVNCGARETLNIPRGRPVAAHPCPNCGCASLTKNVSGLGR